MCGTMAFALSRQDLEFFHNRALLTQLQRHLILECDDIILALCHFQTGVNCEEVNTD
jgi:hypothetical protein